MPRATTTIAFSSLRFLDKEPGQRDVEKRLSSFLRRLRRRAQEEAGEEEDGPSTRLGGWIDLLDDQDHARIRRRAARYVSRVQATTGMQHLTAFVVTASSLWCGRSETASLAGYERGGLRRSFCGSAVSNA